jgi:hypothetical protein
MFKRKNKNLPEQGSDRRQVRRSGAANPAFSYYTSRTPEVNRERAQTRQEQTVETGKSRRPPRSLLAAAPFWLLVALIAVCLLKVLALGTNPKVIVVGKSSVSANYLQPTNVYAAAAHKLLASSITNRSKLTVNLGGTAQTMEREFPELQTVSLGVPLIGSRPIVYVQVASPSLVLQTGHGIYALNGSGVALAKLRSLPAGVAQLVDQSGSTPQLGKQSLPSGTIAFVQTLAYQLAAAHLTISTYVLPASSPYELDVRLEGKPYSIRCNLEADALTQSGAAIATIQHLGGTTPAEYLDVRTPDRVFYK